MTVASAPRSCSTRASRSRSATFARLCARRARSSLGAREPRRRGAAVEIGTLELDGALELDASAPGAKIVVVALSVKNRGVVFEPLGADALALASEEVRMRGFTTRALEVRKVVANAGVTITIDGEKLVASPTELSNRPGFEICSCFA